MITVELPRALAPYAGSKPVIELDDPCSDVGEALSALASRFPGVGDRVVDERGAVRQHVNVFVDDENIRFREGLRTPVSEGSNVLIVAAVSGG